MPVRWSPLAVKEAMDLVDEHVTDAATPLQLAREETKRAMQIPNLPQYMEQELRAVHSDLGWAIDRVRSTIGRVRRDLPKEQMAKEEKQRELGRTQSLV